MFCIKQKSLLVLLLIPAFSYCQWGCSQESGKEGVKGQPEIVHVEKAYDFLDNLRTAEVVSKSINFASEEKTLFTINGDARLVLAQHPNSLMAFKDVLINENAKFEFGIGINQAACDKSGDGVLCEISVIDDTPKNTLIFSKYIDPKNNMEDRRWFDEEVDLSEFSGQEVSFVFKTDGGPAGNTAYDWSGWSYVQIKWELEVALSDYPISVETTKYDLIAEFDQAEIIQNDELAGRIERSKIKVNSDYRISGEEREIILAYPPSEFSYQLEIPDKAFLELGVGIADESVGKEVTFEIYVDNDRIFSQDISTSKSDSQWLDSSIDLSK